MPGESKAIAVFGASGHTGRFVAREIERRGLRAIRVGRDARKLASLGAALHGGETRLARTDDASLDAALAGADAVINCTGPFPDAALPVIDAALRAKIPYLDISAERFVRGETDAAGVYALGAIFDARAFLSSLEGEPFSVRFNEVSEPLLEREKTDA